MKVGSVHLGQRASGLLSQGQVESELMRLAEALENATDESAGRLEAAANAEVEWKCAEALSLLKSTLKSADARKAEALTVHEGKYRDYRISDARSEATKEHCRTLRSQLEALRSIAANVRGQV